MRPLVGITTSELRPGTLGTLRREGAPSHAEMALGMTYAQAVEQAGGLPVVLPPVAVEDVGRLLDRLDALCLAGGPDLDPATYGAAERHPLLGETCPEADAFELAVARAADRHGLPVLGICRGAQALNVARGGTLHQHVDAHRQQAVAAAPDHVVRIAEGTRLARLTGATALEVNSFHHQAVDVLGEGLRVSARAADGTVEAIEGTGDRFVLGVQWHAEAMAGERAHRALFEGLVAGARRHAPLLRVVA